MPKKPAMTFTFEILPQSKEKEEETNLKIYEIFERERNRLDDDERMKRIDEKEGPGHE